MTQPDSPRISVIVPHLNQSEHLANCLRSLMRQTYDLEYVEIIVVDNGSRELPEAICAQFDNIRLSQELTPGPGPARNRGVSVSSAPLLAFIDADCIADKEWLSSVAVAFADPRAEIIGGDVRIALANPDRMTTLEAYESIYAYRQREYIERQGFSGTGNLAMRRAIYEDVGPFAGIDKAEDREWGHRARQRGYTIRYLAQMIVFHPPRRTFMDLRRKWERHIHHDYVQLGHKHRLRWLVKAVALIISPIWEMPRILGTTKVTGFHARRSALLVCLNIRLFRAWHMFRQLMPSNSRHRISWNR
jgi:glycosyltransferase involved in cell wall biosynthesis